jgi:hypothetical protein
LIYLLKRERCWDDRGWFGGHSEGYASIAAIA